MAIDSTKIPDVALFTLVLQISLEVGTVPRQNMFVTGGSLNLFVLYTGLVSTRSICLFTPIQSLSYNQKEKRKRKSGPALSADKKRVYNLSVLWLQDYLEEVFYKTDFAITFNPETS